MKNVVQLDEDGYYVGLVNADESPLEAGVYLIPANAIDVDAPSVPEGKRAKWDNGWTYEDIISEVEEDPRANWTYVEYRASEYPYFSEYLDGIVKGDQAQIDKYIADCLAVKAKYPKE